MLGPGAAFRGWRVQLSPSSLLFVLDAEDGLQWIRREGARAAQAQWGHPARGQNSAAGDVEKIRGSVAIRPSAVVEHEVAGAHDGSASVLPDDAAAPPLQQNSLINFATRLGTGGKCGMAAV